MSTPVQSQAPGYLALLTGKYGGIGPNAVEEAIRPTTEMIDFYGVALRQRTELAQTVAQLDAATGIIGLNTVAGSGWRSWANYFGGAAKIVVPEGEMWRVRNLSFLLTFSVGSVQGNAGWDFGNQFQPYRVVLSGESSALSAALPSAVIGFEGAFFAGPGTSPAFHLKFWDAPLQQADITCTVVYERFFL